MIIIVHELSEVLKDLYVAYASLESKSLEDYIVRKIGTFQMISSLNNGKSMSLEKYFRDTLADSILIAQQFCEEHLGKSLFSFSSFSHCFFLCFRTKFCFST